MKPVSVVFQPRSRDPPSDIVFQVFVDSVLLFSIDSPRLVCESPPTTFVFLLRSFVRRLLPVCIAKPRNTHIFRTVFTLCLGLSQGHAGGKAAT